MIDPIVEEIRSTRERLAIAAGCDTHAIAIAARKRQELSGTQTVSRQPRRPETSRNKQLQPSGGSGVSNMDTSSSAAG